MQQKAKIAIEMETVKHFPTLMRRKVCALLMLIVWGYMTTAETVMSTGFAMLLCLSTTLVVETFSTNPLVNKEFLYICTFEQLYRYTFSYDRMQMIYII